MSRVVLISAFHDYRTAKRASIHQIAKGLASAGHEVAFVSTRFSHLSKKTGDSRLHLWDRANRVELVDGIQCYLWRTTIHPFRLTNKLLNSAMTAFFPAFAELPNTEFDRLISGADYLIVESSAASIYVRRLRRLNPAAKIIYYAADLLNTVGAHPFIQRCLVADRDLVDHFSLRSSHMKGDFSWAPGRLYKADFGMDPPEDGKLTISPYPSGRAVAVSVGSMLFDQSFFQLAAPHFPEIDFHVIGCGTTFAAPSNVYIHPEMPFERTLAYVKQASLGIAPYQWAEGAEYLAESSLKLAQFEYFRLPAVCPTFAAGSVPHRTGYEPHNEASIKQALATALTQVGSVQPRNFPTWKEVGMRVIEPQRYHAELLG